MTVDGVAVTLKTSATAGRIETTAEPIAGLTTACRRRSTGSCEDRRRLDRLTERHADRADAPGARLTCDSAELHRRPGWAGFPPTGFRVSASDCRCWSV